MLLLLTHEQFALNVRTMNAHIHKIIICNENDNNNEVHVNTTENFDERTFAIYENAKAPTKLVTKVIGRTRTSPPIPAMSEQADSDIRGGESSAVL